MFDKSPMLHIVFVDIDPKMEADFNAWYEEVHIPQLLACPGWLSATRRISLDGGPKYVAIYEITGPDAYESPEFNAVKGFGPFTRHVSNFKRIQLKPVPGRSPDVYVA